MSRGLKKARMSISQEFFITCMIPDPRSIAPCVIKSAISCDKTEFLLAHFLGKNLRTIKVKAKTKT